MNSSQHFSKGGSCRDVPFSDGHSASDHTQVSRMHSTIDHDIHDVSFDGDGDPMSPKTLPLVRKWVIVIIVCTGTMCV
jgi:hypothetical protein